MAIVKIKTETLDMLIKGELDKDLLIQRLIQYHPEIFVKLAQTEDLQYEIQLAFTEDGKANKVKAIKKYRELTGTDLRDAKEAVELMIENGEITAGE